MYIALGEGHWSVGVATAAPAGNVCVSHGEGTVYIATGISQLMKHQQLMKCFYTVCLMAACNNILGTLKLAFIPAQHHFAAY